MHAVGLVLSRVSSQVMWQVGSRGHVRSKGHVRCMVGIAVWGRMYGNREFGGEPGSLLLYIITMFQVKAEVAEKPERHSILYMPHPFVAPGDRFREFYYW